MPLAYCQRMPNSGLCGAAIFLIEVRRRAGTNPALHIRSYAPPRYSLGLGDCIRRALTPTVVMLDRELASLPVNKARTFTGRVGPWVTLAKG